MIHPNLDTLNAFTAENIPDLDICVMAALELFMDAAMPRFDVAQFKRPLVVGSGNAAVTGRVLFIDSPAIFADESTYQDRLASDPEIDAVVLVSASGTRHTAAIAEEMEKEGKVTWLFTNNPKAPARKFVADERELLFSCNREPYTYNTSTYMGMILSSTGERPSQIYEFIKQKVDPIMPKNFADYDSFFLIVPRQFEYVGNMMRTKFDELFGPKVGGRVFTIEQAKHSKTVVPSEKELFISFDEVNEIFGTPKTRCCIPLPPRASHAAMMAIGYYVIGHIQKQHPPYFKEHIAEYTKQISKVFGYEIDPIVE